MIEDKRMLTDFYNVFDEENLGIEEVIKREMKSYLGSQKYKQAEEGINYYNAEHDIKNRRILFKTKQGWKESSMKNYKIKSPYHKILADQKISYIAGENWELKTDEALKQILEDNYFDTDFLNNIVQEVALDATNTGDSYLHYYLEDGKLNFISYSNIEIIAIKDTKYNKNIEKLIRFYTVLDKNNEKVYKIELWDKQYTTYFEMKIINNEYIVKKDYTQELNPMPHYITYNNITNEIDEKGFGVIPFIHFKNNRSSLSDLNYIKDFIDALDITESDWSNLNENQITAAWLFKNISPLQDIDEILTGMNANGGAKIPEGVELERIDIKLNHESKVERIKDLTSKIYELGMGVNQSQLITSNISGIVLKLMYQGLDLKSDQFTKTNMQNFYKLYEIILSHINILYKKNFSLKDLAIKPVKQLIIDKKEIEEIKKLKAETMLILDSMISRQSQIEELGFDYDQEMERLDEEGIKDLGIEDGEF